MAITKKQTKIDGEATLPATRKQLFIRILKEDFYLLVDLSLAETLFSLPLFAALVALYLLLTGQTNLAENVFAITFYLSLIAVPCWGVKYVGRNACFSVMKKRVHNEGCFITAQIITSVKSSGLRAFLMGTITGLSAFIAACGSLYLLLFASTWLKWVGVGVLLLQFAICFGAAEYFCASENFYSLKLSDQLKNSFSFSIMGFLTTIIHFLVVVGIKFTAAFLSPYAAVISIFIYALILSGATVAAATLVAHHYFDLLINKDNYPEYVGRGLLKSDEVINNG